MSNFHELMQYFNMVFYACYIVPVILFVNILRVHENKCFQHIWIEYGLDFLLGLILFRFAVFMGVIEDISSVYSHWTNKLLVIIFISFILFITHIIMLLKRNHNSI